MCYNHTIYCAQFIRINTYNFIEDDNMSDRRNILGPRIRYFRKKIGLTQEELAARLQVKGVLLDRPMISKIESQTRELLDYEILAIADVLRIDIKDIFYR